MVWVQLYDWDAAAQRWSLTCVCPAEDANLWYLLDGSRWFKYVLIPDDCD